VVIDLPPAGLDDVDVFFSNGLLDFDSSLADSKLREKDIGLGHTQVVADGASQLWVGGSPDDDNVSDHFLPTRWRFDAREERKKSSTVDDERFSTESGTTKRPEKIPKHGRLIDLHG
jgi:hypothetical protein